MLVTITRNPSDMSSEADFIGSAKYIPGMGPIKARDLYKFAPISVEIPPEKAATATRHINRLIEAGKITVHGLPDTPERTEPVADKASPEKTLDAIRDLIGGAVNEARIIELIHEHAAQPATVAIDLRTPHIEVSGETIMHHRFPELVAAVSAGVNVMLVGPAGSGKTTAAMKTAEALRLPFYATSAVSNEFKLSGFIDAQGRIVSTEFKRAFENGGVFLFDEMDGSSAAALLAFNAALANDWYDFPGGMVKRHPDFRVIAGANTYGTGADRQYIGRNQLDAASLDRYAVMAWGYDEAIEAAMVGAPVPKGLPRPGDIIPLGEVAAQSAAHVFFERVRRVRAAVADLKVRHVVSPRATLNGARLLAAGWRIDAVEDAVLWKGIDADTKNKINQKAA